MDEEWQPVDSEAEQAPTVEVLAEIEDAPVHTAQPAMARLDAKIDALLEAQGIDPEEV